MILYKWPQIHRFLFVYFFKTCESVAKNTGLTILKMIFNTKKILAGLAAAALLAACQKADLPDGIDSAPVFRVFFAADGNNQSLSAGENGCYLFTSHDRDGADVVTMRGAFAPADCPAADCPGTMIFEFRNFEPGAVIETDSQVLPPGVYAYKTLPGTTDSIPRLFFSIDNPDSTANYFWEIRQSNQLVAEGSGPALSHLFSNLEPVEARLQYAAANGSSGVVMGNYLFNQPACPQVSIVATNDSVGNYVLAAEVNPPAGIYTYQWNTGVSMPSILVDSVELWLLHSVTVTDANGCIASASATNLSGPQQSPRIGISRQDSIVVIDSLQLGRVAIQWIDPATGQVFRSDWGPQPPASAFQVIDSWLYTRNENGEKTTGLQVAFDCRLYNNDGGWMPFQGQGTVAVAYP